MRLYLSSFKVGNRPETILDLVGAGRRAGVIMNALDGGTANARSEWLLGQLQALRTLGFSPSEIDLRDYFGAPDRMSESLAAYDFLWVNGGNTFVLRRAMAESGFDDALRGSLEQDALAYGGFSAGSIVMTPSLRGSELVDHPSDVPPGYPNEIVWDGLGIVDFHIAPHFKSNHPESADVDRMVEYFERHRMTYRAIVDGRAIVVSGETITEVG